jgi:hypothetical protein
MTSPINLLRRTLTSDRFSRRHRRIFLNNLMRLLMNLCIEVLDAGSKAGGGIDVDEEDAKTCSDNLVISL